MSSIQFSLFAPYNSEAILIGDFSDWRDISMQKGEDGFFRTEVDLQDGAYQYKFRVRSQSWFFHPDAWVEVVDPYATDINDANQTGILRVKDGEAIVDTYVWQHDDVPLPADHQLVIYELHVGDFSGGEPDPAPLRKQTHALYTNNIDFLHDDPEAKVLAYVRWNTEGSQVAVLANCSAHYLADYTVKNFPQGGTWHEWTHDYDINVDGTELTLDLPEYEAKVLVW